MRKILIIVCVGIGWLQADWQAAYTHMVPWRYIDFDFSMQTHMHKQAIDVTEQVAGYDGAEFLNHARVLFAKNNPSVLPISDGLIIPKDMHQIWLGSKLPEVFLPLMQSWKEYHKDRGWRHFLWVDNPQNYVYGDVVVTTEQQLLDIVSHAVHELPASIVVDVHAIVLDNQKFYDEIDNYGMKSDLLKWEIIYRYGGVYIDMDFECLGRPLDILHYTYDFYTGMQPLNTLIVQLGAALFAGYPRHPILEHCIATIKDDWHHNGAPKKSGPVHFSKSFLQIAGQQESRDVALPAHYLYPLGCRQFVKEENRDEVYTSWLENGSFAVHHWAKSWMPKQYRPMLFRTIDNDQSSQSWND